MCLTDLWWPHGQVYVVPGPYNSSKYTYLSLFPRPPVYGSKVATNVGNRWTRKCSHRGGEKQNSHSHLRHRHRHVPAVVGWRATRSRSRREPDPSSSTPAPYRVLSLSFLRALSNLCVVAQWLVLSNVLEKIRCKCRYYEHYMNRSGGVRHGIS